MNREQCKGCVHFRAGGGGDKMTTSYKFCHHLLDTNRRRAVGEDEVCLSRTTKREKAKSRA